MADSRIKILQTDMSSDMQQEVITIALQQYQTRTGDRDMAREIKEKFDMNYGASWHCVVGQRFGSLVTHQEFHMIYFYVAEKAVMLWKAGSPV